MGSGAARVPDAAIWELFSVAINEYRTALNIQTVSYLIRRQSPEFCCLSWEVPSLVFSICTWPRSLLFCLACYVRLYKYELILLDSRWTCMQFTRHPSREALIRAGFFEPPIRVFWRLPLQHPGAPFFFLLILHVPLHGPCRLCTGLDPSVEPQAPGTGSQQLTLGFGIPRELLQPCSRSQLRRDYRKDFGTFWIPKQGVSGYIPIGHEDPRSRTSPRTSELINVQSLALPVLCTQPGSWVHSGRKTQRWLQVWGSGFPTRLGDLHHGFLLFFHPSLASPFWSSCAS